MGNLDDRPVPERRNCPQELDPVSSLNFKYLWLEFRRHHILLIERDRIWMR